MIESEISEAYSRDSFVNVFPFSRQFEGDEAIIGRAETGTFLSVPREAVEILDYLANGKRVGEAADLFREEHGQAPELEDFLATLQAKGLVAPAGKSGEVTGEWTSLHQAAGVPKEKRYHLANFPQSLARRIFSPLVVRACLVSIGVALFLLLRDPDLFPRLNNLYIANHRTFTITMIALVGYVSLLLHELAHLVAARAVGVNSRIGIGRRIYDFVVETDLTGLWSVPKRQRYMPLLAGMLLDATAASLMIFVEYASKKGWLHFSTTGLHIWLTLLLAYLIRIGWQGLLFVRTDFYYVVSTWFNCRNLLLDTEHYLGNHLARIFPQFRVVDQSTIPAQERRVLPYFSVVWVAGRVLAVWWMCVFIFPVMCHYVADLLRCVKGMGTDPVAFWQSLGMVCAVVGPPIIGLVLWLRSITRHVSFLMGRGVQHA